MDERKTLAALLVPILLFAICVIAYWQTVGRPSAVREESRPASAPVRAPEGEGSLTVRAFVDGESPAEERTVEFLERLRSAYRGRARFEILDYRDEGHGSEAWMAAQLESAAILLDGTPYVAFERDGRKTPIGFVMPAGFGWDYRDLADAVAAGVAGTLERVDAETAVGARKLPVLKPKLEARSESEGPDGATTLVIEGLDVATIRCPYKGVSPEQRVASAIGDLERILEEPVSPEMLVRQSTGAGEWVIGVDKRGLLNATDEDGRAEGISARALSRIWLESLRDGLALAAAPQGEFPPLPDPAEAAAAESGPPARATE